MDNIEVNALNIFSIPKEWVIIRYGQLRRRSQTKKGDSVIANEIAIIEKFFEDQGIGFIINAYTTEGDLIEQDLPVPLRKQYIPIVEERITEYYLRMKRKEKIEGEIERLQQSAMQVSMPMITASYGAVSGGSGGLPSSSTERAALRVINKVEGLMDELADLEDLMEPMVKVFGELKQEQFDLIKEMFFTKQRLPDEFVMKKLCWGRQKFYRIKKETLIKVAQKLNVI